MACYWHACLRRLDKKFVTNSSLRERFRLAGKQSSAISRLLSATCAAGLIKLASTADSGKERKFVPYWA